MSFGSNDPIEQVRREASSGANQGPQGGNPIIRSILANRKAKKEQDEQKLRQVKEKNEQQYRSIVAEKELEGDFEDVFEETSSAANTDIEMS